MGMGVVGYARVGKAGTSGWARMWTRWMVAASVIPLLVACGADGDVPEHSTATPEEEIRGRLVIVGGALADENAPVWEAVLEGRDGLGPVCVIPTASGVPERSMQSAVESLDRYGGDGTAMGILIREGEVEVADDPGIAGTVLTCSGFWFTGGSQSRITETFMPDGTATSAYQAVRERFLEGAVVAGSSAGAAMMSDPMIAGGSSEGALVEGIRDEDEEDGVRIDRGLGFFETGVLDQHFLARGRIGRLLVAVRDHPEIDVGFGIDENTAMIVDGRVAEVVGASGVVVVDGRGSREAGPLRVTLAGAGDRIELSSLDVTFAPDKTPVEAGQGTMPGSGIFDDWVFLNTLAALSSTPESVASFESTGGRLTFTEAEGFRAVAAVGGEGIAGAPPAFSAGPFDVELAAASR